MTENSDILDPIKRVLLKLKKPNAERYAVDGITNLEYGRIYSKEELEALGITYLRTCAHTDGMFSDYLVFGRGRERFMFEPNKNKDNKNGIKFSFYACVDELKTEQ